MLKTVTVSFAILLLLIFNTSCSSSTSLPREGNEVYFDVAAREFSETTQQDSDNFVSTNVTETVQKSSETVHQGSGGEEGSDDAAGNVTAVGSSSNKVVERLQSYLRSYSQSVGSALRRLSTIFAANSVPYVAAVTGHVRPNDKRHGDGSFSIGPINFTPRRQQPAQNSNRGKFKLSHKHILISCNPNAVHAKKYMAQGITHSGSTPVGTGRKSGVNNYAQESHW
jgi:hypothetical protein